MFDPRRLRDHIQSVRHRLREWIRRHSRSIAAASLNATGMSLGHFYLGAPRRGVTQALLTSLLLSSFIAFEVLRPPLVLFTTTALWLSCMVVDGWLLGRRQEHAPYPRLRVWEPAPQTAFAILVVVAIASAYLQYLNAGKQVLDAGTAAHRAGDCAGALNEYSTFASEFELAATIAATAERQAEDCEDYLAAVQLEVAGDPALSFRAFLEHADIYPTSPVAEVRNLATNRTFRRWTAQLASAGRSTAAMEACSDHVDRLAADDPAKTAVEHCAGLLIAFAEEMQAQDRHEDALRELERYGPVFPADPAKTRLHEAVTRIALRFVQALHDRRDFDAGSRVCGQYRARLVDDGGGRRTCGRIELGRRLLIASSPRSSVPEIHQAIVGASSIGNDWLDSVGRDDVADLSASAYGVHVSAPYSNEKYCDVLASTEMHAALSQPGTEDVAREGRNLHPWALLGCVTSLYDAGDREGSARRAAEMDVKYPGSPVAQLAALYASGTLQGISFGAKIVFGASAAGAIVCAVARIGTCVEKAVQSATAAGRTVLVTDAGLAVLKCLPEIELGRCVVDDALALLVPGLSLPKKVLPREPTPGRSADSSSLPR